MIIRIIRVNHVREVDFIIRIRTKLYKINYMFCMIEINFFFFLKSRYCIKVIIFKLSCLVNGKLCIQLNINSE